MNTQRDRNRIPRLVWVLAGVAMGAGVLTMGMEYRALKEIREDRDRTKVVEARATASFRALRMQRENVFRGFEAHFTQDQDADRTAPHLPGSLDRFVAECRGCLKHLEGDPTTIDAAVTAMERSIARLCVIHQELEQFDAETARTRGSLSEAWQRVREALATMKGATLKLGGRRRLRQEVLLRRYRHTAGEEAAELAGQYIDEQGLVGGLRTLKLDLSDMVLLAQRLYGESEIDQLVSLKDNEMRQTLVRLHRAADKVEAAGGMPLTAHLASIQEAIFGKGSVDDPAHQTLVVGQGGLFSLQRKKLMLEAEGRRLRKTVSEKLYECVEAERGLDHVLSAALDAQAVRAGSTMRAAWYDSLITGAFVAVGFLILSWRIARLGRLTEARLQSKNQELEATAGFLGVARQEAEAADLAKSDFLANMSHEIRTPMTAILGFAENMLDADQSESDKLNCVHTILRNGENLLHIINDILDISKIEAGKMTIERRDCHPCRVVAEVASLMRVRADAKGLSLDIAYAGVIPETIQSDSTRLRQILINLIGNAIKFTEAGAVRLVTRLVEDGHEPRLQFDVIDTGHGMTEEQRVKLFRPFVQADSSTTRKFGGTGLGLTISRRFAELLGGDITVAASELGVGSTFRVTVATGSLDGVKMLDDPMSATIVDATLSSAGQVPRPDLKGLRILLAEDGPDNQRLISFVLKKAGADVSVEENGKLALEAALAARDEGASFDVILMDMQMPVMDGYEATSLLRRKGYTGPIIALTAHAMGGDREKCIKAGCDDYATKPIAQKKLIALVSAAAQESHRSDRALPSCAGMGEEANVVPRVARSNLQGCRILLAEDNPTNQVLIAGIFKKLGAEVTTVKDGKLALDAALAARDDGNPFDVILMDMQMPVMDGYEAAEQLRSQRYNRTIIALTAHSMAGDKEKCIAAGCDDYARKPIVRKKLIETVLSHLAPSEVACPTTE